MAFETRFNFLGTRNVWSLIDAVPRGDMPERY
jgi:hypothetical protein